MLSPIAHHEHSGRKLSGSKNQQKYSTREDPELTEFLAPTSARQPSFTRGPFEDRAHVARQQIIDNRYSNIELPEVVVPKPRSINRPERERVLSDEQLKSRESNKYFVPPNARPRSRYQRTDTEGGVHSMLSSPATTLYTISNLILFSILGTLARLGVEAITFYASAPIISPVLWPNLGGSLILGFLSEDRRIFREEWGVFSSAEDWSFHPTTIESDNADTSQHSFQNHARVKKTIPLCIGLATGFCGSFTSFSSFIRDAFLALSNELRSPSPNSPSIPSRNGGYSFEALLAILIVHFTVSLSAFKFGAHLASALDPMTPTLPFKSIRMILDPLFVFLGFGCWIGAVLLTVFTPHRDWRGRVTYALCFTPLGCLLRYYVSKHLNPRNASFPLGTFAVNIFGTIILGMCFDLQHSRTGDIMTCRVLQGVMDGFCGSTTTVSSWVAEVNGLKRKHAYIYALASVFVALSFSIVIMGSLKWTRGFENPTCT